MRWELSSPCTASRSLCICSRLFPALSRNWVPRPALAARGLPRPPTAPARRSPEPQPARRTHLLHRAAQFVLRVLHQLLNLAEHLVEGGLLLRVAESRGGLNGRRSRCGSRRGGRGDRRRQQQAQQGAYEPPHLRSAPAAAAACVPEPDQKRADHPLVRPAAPPHAPARPLRPSSPHPPWRRQTRGPSRRGPPAPLQPRAPSPPHPHSLLGPGLSSSPIPRDGLLPGATTQPSSQHPRRPRSPPRHPGFYPGLSTTRSERSSGAATPLPPQPRAAHSGAINPLRHPPRGVGTQSSVHPSPARARPSTAPRPSIPRRHPSPTGLDRAVRGLELPDLAGTPPQAAGTGTGAGAARGRGARGDAAALVPG